jgi:hypothetical protein
MGDYTRELETSLVTELRNESELKYTTRLRCLPGEQTGGLAIL